MEGILVFVSVSSIPLLIFILLRKYMKTRSSKTRNPPGPPRLPFIGNLHQLNIQHLHICLWKLSKQYGPLMSLKLGSKSLIVVSSGKLAEEVTRNQDLIFCSKPKFYAWQKLSYNGSDIAMAAYSQEWREMRKICVLHLLSAKRTQDFRPIREDEAFRMVIKIRSDAESGKATNLSETIVSISISIICRISYGKSFRDDEAPERRRFDALLQEMSLVVDFFFSDYIPLIGWMDYLSGIHFRLDKAFKKFDSFCEELIDEHLDPNRPSSMDGDIIDIMLKLQRDGSISFDISLDHIKAMLMDIFFAGTITSSSTIIWAMTDLIKNPSIMERAQAEIREAIGSKEIIDEDDIEKLPYIKAIVKESMRLHSVVPLLSRETLEKGNLDGYEIQPNTLVFVNSWSITRDPEMWENPNEFFPERFLNSDTDDKWPDEFLRLIPFGSGRRSFPGYSMGLLIVHLLLSNLQYSFDWELPSRMKREDIDTEPSPSIVVSKKNDLILVPLVKF